MRLLDGYLASPWGGGVNSSSSTAGLTSLVDVLEARLRLWVDPMSMAIGRDHCQGKERIA